MTDDKPDVRPEDALQVAQRALAKIGDLEEELQRMDDLEEELTAIKLRVSEFDEEKDYHERTLDDKIGKVREYAFRKASESNGLATLDYDDIMWSVFDGEPGTKHCYKLMRLAAGDTEEAQEDMNEGCLGYAVRDPAGGNKHLAVNADRAKRNRAVFPENKAAEGGVQ